MNTQEKISFERLLTNVIESQAQTLHLSAGSPPILKLDTGLTPLASEKILDQETIENLVFSFLSEEQRAVLKKAREITVVHSFKPQLRFKVNIFYQKATLAATFKFIPTQIKNLKELGLPQVEKLLPRFSHGVIVLSGPFSSGKSTAVAAIIEALNVSASKYIITLEDPIEFVFTNKKSVIEQRQIGADVVSFKEGLDFLAEEQVDVIVISEIRSPEVARQAFELAQSGRLIIFQIAADSALKTVENLANLFSSADQASFRGLMAGNLAAVINLHLLKKIGGGYVPAPEILINNQPTSAVLRKGDYVQLANILQTSSAEGMISFEKSLSNLIRDNLIKPENVEQS